MEALALVATAAGIHLLAVMSPGPNFVVISRNSLAYSRRSGMFTTLGVTSGVFILLALGFVGITALIAQSETAYNAVRFAGAAYLVVIGVRSLMEASRSRVSASQESVRLPDGLGARASFRMGFITALTNPKAAVYLLAFFTTIISAHTGVGVKVTLLFLMPTITFSWYSIMAWLFSHPVLRRKYARFERWAHVVFGVLLIVLGAGVALSSR
ncbi:MAG: LysE family translocator [Acidimicrobiia bacterium]|nr:LysE family translocator [Acidimicrobiia bacterium]